MGDVLVVEVLQAAGHLPEPHLRLLFRDDAVALYEVEEVAVVCISGKWGPLSKFSPLDLDRIKEGGLPDSSAVKSHATSSSK